MRQRSPCEEQDSPFGCAHPVLLHPQVGPLFWTLLLSFAACLLCGFFSLAASFLRARLTERSGTAKTWKKEDLAPPRRSSETYPKVSVIEQFLQQVAREPKGIALKSPELSVSYEQLLSCALQCARLVSPYLDLERLQELVKLTKPAVVLCDDERPFQELEVPLVQAEQLTLDASDPYVDGESAAGVQLESVAQVIYTSGSTGEPKGVIYSHGRLAFSTHFFAEQCHVTGGTRVLQKTPNIWSVFRHELYPSLCRGGQVIHPEPLKASDPVHLAETIRSNSVSLLVATPTVLELILDSTTGTALSSLSRVVCMGEPLSWRLVRRVRQQLSVEVMNFYGSTETENSTYTIALGRRDLPSAGVVPAGQPQPHVSIHLLNPASMELSDPGAEGEELEVLGRLDRQVKIRGCRVELQELEVLLGSLVGTCAAVAVQGEMDHLQIVAFVGADCGFDLETLSEEASKILSPQLMPSLFVLLPDLPRLNNGKVNLVKLKVLASDALANQPAETYAVQDSLGVLQNLSKSQIEEDRWIQNQQAFWTLLVMMQHFGIVCMGGIYSKDDFGIAVWHVLGSLCHARDMVAFVLLLGFTDARYAAGFNHRDAAVLVVAVVKTLINLVPGPLHVGAEWFLYVYFWCRILLVLLSKLKPGSWQVGLLALAACMCPDDFLWLQLPLEWRGRIENSAGGIDGKGLRWCALFMPACYLAAFHFTCSGAFSWCKGRGISWMNRCVDGLGHYLDAFIRQHAAQFEGSEEQCHGGFETFQRYEALVDRLLNEFLEEHRRDLHLAGIEGSSSVRRVLRAWAEEGGGCHSQGLEALMRVTCYEEYLEASMCAQRAAELKAKEMLQRLAVQVAGGLAAADPDARLEAATTGSPAFVPPLRGPTATASPPYVGISLAFQGPKALMCVLQEHARSCSASSTDRYVGTEAPKPEEGLRDEQYWRQAIEKDYEMLGHAPLALRQDRELLSKLLAKHGLALMHCTGLRGDRPGASGRPAATAKWQEAQKLQKQRRKVVLQERRVKVLDFLRCKKFNSDVNAAKTSCCGLVSTYPLKEAAREKHWPMDEWELLNRLSAKELRILAARKCAPVQLRISTAVEKIDLINLIVKAGPVLDQYDVSVGVWTAESIENHQPGEKKAKAKKKEKILETRELDERPRKEKKEKALALEDKKRKKGSSDSDAPKVPKALPAAKVPAGTVEDLDLDDDEVVACEAPPKVAEAAVAVRAGTAEAAPKRRRAVEIQVVEIEDGKDEEAKDTGLGKNDRRRRARKEKEAKEKEAKESEAKEKDLKEAEAKEKEVKEKELKEKEAKEKEAKEKELKEKELSEKETKEKEGKEKAKPKNTAQAGVAAAAALGFDVLPKQSSFVPPTAPALGLRPSINAPIPLPANSNPTQSRVCVQYLCWARCDRGSNCPEAHIMDPEEEMRVRAKFKLQECNQGASCTRTSCLFRHPGEHVEEEAETVDVEVEDPELRACGTFSKRYVLISLLVLCLWHLLRVLVIVSGFFCAPGLWHGWAASLSGEADCGWTHKLVSLLVISLVAMLAARAQVADFPLYGISTIASFLSGPLLQYYQTRWSHPSRHLFDCLLWTLAQLVGTIGLAAVLSVIVVLYRTLLEPEMNGGGHGRSGRAAEFSRDVKKAITVPPIVWLCLRVLTKESSWPVFANVFLPVSTAVVEGGMVSFTQMMYTTLVVKRRPAVPGDVSFVAMPYMLTCLHGFAEAARIVGVFSGAVTGGAYTWLGSLGVGLLLNVLARCGWTRLGLYMVLKQLLPLRWALVFAPGAYGKLHDAWPC
eukprot:g28001.t1